MGFKKRKIFKVIDSVVNAFVAFAKREEIAITNWKAYAIIHAFVDSFFAATVATILAVSHC